MQFWPNFPLCSGCSIPGCPGMTCPVLLYLLHVKTSSIWETTVVPKSHNCRFIWQMATLVNGIPFLRFALCNSEYNEHAQMLKTVVIHRCGPIQWVLESTKYKEIDLSQIILQMLLQGGLVRPPMNYDTLQNTKRSAITVRPQQSEFMSTRWREFVKTRLSSSTNAMLPLQCHGCD